MLRRSLLLLLTACGAAYGPIHTIGDSRVGVQYRAVGAARLIAFVAPTATTTRDGARADFAMALDDGGWLAIVNDTLVRLSADGTTVGWSRKGIQIWDAVLGSAGRVVAVGTLADPAALNGALRAVFAIELATGDVVWQAVTDPTRRGASARLARAGVITVAVSAYGEAGIDDAGTLLWEHSRLSPGDDPAVAAIDAQTVAVATTPTFSTSEISLEPKHLPALVRTLDAATGAERDRAELPAEGDRIHLGELAVAGDGRIAIRASDLRVHGKPGVTRDGEPTLMVTQDTKQRLLVIDARAPGSLRVASLEMPVPTEARRSDHACPESARGRGGAEGEGPKASCEIEIPLPATLIATEVAFLDRYATPSETLGVTIVDLASRRARRAAIARPRRVAVGEGVDSFIQVLRLSGGGDRLSFAGIFAGEVTPLRARVREVDACVANGQIECSVGRETTTLAPFAGFIGAIAFQRAP
jgi:hypothetical protein